MIFGAACEHGSLARSCLICELTAERDVLKAQVERLSGKTGYCAQCEAYAKERDYWKSLALKAREALESMWSQFSYPTKDGKGCSGGLSALEDCETFLADFPTGEK